MNNDKVLVSIIVPVYNCEEYIGQCIEGLLSQTYDNIKIILVDDGSTDGSYNICESFSDERISLHRKENGGVSSARNYGMRFAEGKYILFVDSDDYLEAAAIEELLKAAEDNKADCVYYEAENYADHPEIKIKEGGLLRKFDYQMQSGDELIPKLIKNRDYHAAPFLFFICRSVISDLSFEEGIRYEDELFSFELLRRCEKVVCLRRVLYHRRVRPGSMVTTHGKEKFQFMSMYRVFNRLLEQRMKKDDPVSDMYIARIGMLLLERWDAMLKCDKLEMKNHYQDTLSIIRKENGFSSKELLVRCRGFVPWAVYVAPRKIIKRIKRRVHK